MGCRAVLLAASLCALACGDDPAPFVGTQDAGPQVDAATNRPDADADVPLEDVGVPTDAGDSNDAEMVADAGSLDAAPPPPGSEPCIDVDTLPICGPAVPELEALDRAMQTFTMERDISAGSLGVMKDGVIVLMHGFGWLDRERTMPTPSAALFRLASVTKPFTAAAIRRLIEMGRLSLDSYVFDLGQAEGGLLALDPFGGALGDPRLEDVTVEHLLQHRGGWDRDIAGDLTYQERAIAEAMGVESPAGRENIARYILSQPLQHAPGAEYAYSNIGFMLLGMITEALLDDDHLEVVRNEVFAPVGVGPEHIKQARTFESDRDPLEPWYDARDSTATNVFDPMGPMVEWPYGGWDMEARIGQGGMIANSFAVLRFLGSHTVAGDDIGTPRSWDSSNSWTHTGGFTGTATVATQRSNGVAIAVMFNRRESGEEISYAISIRDLLLVQAGLIRDWPTR